MQNATTTQSTSKAWETKPATSQQRYALFKLTGDSSYKTKKKLTGRMASDLIHDLSAKAVAKKKEVAKAKSKKALPKAKAVAPKKAVRKPKASGHYVLQGDGATELKGDIKAIALDVKSASAHLRKSADALSSALDRLSSLL